MSTKYYGNIVRNASISEVFNLVKSKYNDFNNTFNSYMKKEFVKFAFEQIDRSLISNKKTKKKDIYDLSNEFHKKNYLNVNSIVSVKICFFPYKKNILIMNCSDFLFDDIYNSFEFEDYSYWNNTDKPEDVSVREWNKRFKVWEEVCPDCPANNSLMYNPHFNQVKNFPFLWKYEDLKEYFEKYNAEKRFERYTRNHEFANQYTGKYKPNPWIEVKEKMITINEKNFNDVFDCVEDKK